MSTAPTPLLFFHDTTVLLNFGLAGQLDALAHLLADGRGAWTATVAYETKRQGHKHGLPSLRDRASDILGEPLRPEAAEHRLIRDRRKDFAQPGDAPDQHLGEAETLTIIEQRSLRAVFVTDDGHVPPLTTVTCIDTWELVRACLRRTLMDLDEVLAMRTCLLEHRRVHRAQVRDLDAFKLWLDA